MNLQNKKIKYTSTHYRTRKCVFIIKKTSNLATRFVEFFLKYLGCIQDCFILFYIQKKLMKTHNNIFNTIFSLENLFDSWKQFRKRKTQRLDVQKFEVNLEKNIFQLYENLNSWKYKHWTYYWFYIFDPKQRHIHKASVRDRIVHQAIYAFLTNIFEKSFIHHSYSSRLEKWSHK